MLYHLLLYRSLTRIQRASSLLDKTGIPNRVVRVPARLSEEGCSNALRLSQGNLHRALSTLRSAGMDPRRVFVAVGDDTFEEVLF